MKTVKFLSVVMLAIGLMFTSLTSEAQRGRQHQDNYQQDNYQQDNQYQQRNGNRNHPQFRGRHHHRHHARRQGPCCQQRPTCNNQRRYGRNRSCFVPRPRLYVRF